MQSSAGSGAKTQPLRVLAAIVHFGAAHVAMTARAAASVLDQQVEGGLTILVIDNGSDEATIRDLRATLDPRVEVKKLPVNRGYGAAANVAIELAATQQIDLVWVLNNDLLVEPGALASLIDALATNESLAAVAPVTIDEGSPPMVLGAGVELSLLRARARHRHTGRSATTIPSGVERVDAIEAAAVLIRVSAARLIGGFDERFFMYWEDTEWSVRARRAGWQLGVASNARVRHLVARSSLPTDRAELMIGNRVRFARTVLGWPGNLLFAGYMALWLPAYTLARLWPGFGARRAVAIATRAISRNLRDARHQGGWLIAPWSDPTDTARVRDNRA